MINHKPIHREHALDHALAYASHYLKTLNMSDNLQLMKKTGQFETYLCLVNNHNLQLTFRGAGSGLSVEAKVKAIYEAMENSLLHQVLSDTANEKLHLFSTQTSPSTAFLNEQKLLPSVLQQKNYLDNAYPWLKLNKLNSATASIYYPVGLMFPHSNYREISQIANSTGVALGSSASEAIIHGINDWIERDAYGLFLLNTLIKKTKLARHILKQSLPDDIKEAVKLIEHVYRDEVMIIDITTDYGIPAFFVSFTKQPVPVQPSGLGASLCKKVALRQALYEALQMRDRYNQNAIEARQKTIQHYQNYPLLLRAYLCNLIQLRQENGVDDINWEEVKTHQISSTLDEQIEAITAKIEGRHCAVYYSHLFQDVRGLTLTYVLLVGAETFGTMKDGLFTPIKKRGLELLHE